MGRKIWKKIGVCLLVMVMTITGLQTFKLPVAAVGKTNLEQSDYVEGTIKRAPATADLEENGNLGWIHCNVKTQSQWAGSAINQIRDVKLEGNLAQIMNDTDTNFVYSGSPSDNHKGQVINGLGGMTSFILPASLEKRYVSVFTGSWASQVELTVYINDKIQYSNIHGKTATTSGAESYLTQFSYYTDNESDEVKVVIKTIEVFDTTYGNQSIQGIALSDKEQNYGSSLSEGLVQGELIKAPEYVNLSKQGDIDWIHMDSAQFGSFNRKNVLDAGITEMTLIGNCDYVTTNVETNFVYSDGMSNLMSPEVNKKGLVFTGANNGFSFKVPGSVENRCLDIYTGAWAADIKVTVEINGEEAYAEIFGSNDTTAGSPAKYQTLKIDYHTDSVDDTVKVIIKVNHTYDNNWGNMNIGGITLGTRRIEDDGSIIGGIMKTAPSAVNLSEEGSVDWLYLNDPVLSEYNRKDVETHLISDVTLIGKAQGTPISEKTKTAFSYNDGISPVEENNGHKAYVFQGEGSGIEFKLPGSKEMKYINFYAGAWAADVKLEVLVNDTIQYSSSFGSSSTIPDTTNYQVARIQYRTSQVNDEVKIRAIVTKGYDSTWANMNVSAITVSNEAPVNIDETIKTDNWIINHSGGEISELKTKIADEMYNIPVRQDQYSGFVWTLNGEKVILSSVDEDDQGNKIYTGTYKNNGKNLTFTIGYSVNELDQMVVSAAIKNNLDEESKIDQASIQLGFNTYLEKYPDYNDQLFPTLIRCEKTHAWGYLSTPSGRLMTIATDSPVASYTLDYQSGAHRIYSASLDVLQSGKLPERHPQGLDKLAPGEEKTWNIYLKPVTTLNAIEDVKEVIAKNTDLPMFDADRYTLAQGEQSQITILSKSAIKDNKLTIEDPEGNISKLDIEKESDGNYKAVFEAADKLEGVYKITAENAEGYIAEMNLSIRKDWSWYIKKAREAAVEAPQKGTSHGESYYGLYSAYIAKKYFPDALWDDQIDEKFEEIYPLMYDVDTGLPTSWQDRIQNHSTTLGIFVDQYQSSGNIESLKKAEVLADFLMTKQKADGGYYNGSTDYTSVIYPAKSIMELVYVEKDLIEDNTLSESDREYYRERYDLHMASLTKAMDKLVRVDGNFDTEGQATFEDGANSCSITQLSEFALMFPAGSKERQKYAEAAEKYMERHTSHQQSIIPDSRMNGGTLRFWEAQYDVEMGLTSTAPNMMNSPHGWSAWSIYGLFNLYELTGNVEYLERGMNAMGSCAQLMGYDGILNWAFIADPQRDTNFFVKDEEASIDDKIVGKHVRKTIGEEYVPMISYWWRAPKNTWVPGYTAMGGSVVQGAACDNDVHEVFKAMGEVALTKAYIVEKADGTFEAYNAVVDVTDDLITITPFEDVVSNVSVKLLNDKKVTVNFYNGTIEEKVLAGNPVWIVTEENAVDTSTLDKDSSLKDLEVTSGKLDKEFDKTVYDYSVDIGAQAGQIGIKPVSSSSKAIVYVDGNKVENGDTYIVKLDSALMEKNVKIVVKSEMQANSTTYTVKVTSMGNCKILSTEGQKAIAKSQHSTSGSEGPAANVLDNNISSIWHTNYSGGIVDIKDRWIEIQLANEETVCGVRYLPRQSGDNGKFLKYEIYISNDDGETYEKVLQGEWDKSNDWKVAVFDKVKATNVRIVPIETSGEFGSAAEIRIVGINEEINKALLIETIEAAKTINLDYYQDGVEKADFITILANANILLETASTQSEIDEAVAALNDAIKALIPKTVDKTALSIAVEVANNVSEEELAKVVPAVANEFNAALEEAKALLADAAASQEAVDASFDRLATAIQMLDFIKGDKAALRSLVNMVNGKDEALYTEATWEVFAAKLETANNVLADENAFQEEVDEAYDGLIRAYLSLRLIPNKDALNDLINKANGLNAASYSPESWAAVSLALENANTAMANANATQEEVNAAAEALSSAIEGLVEAEVSSASVNEGVTNTAVKAGDTTASIKTGDSASLGYSVAGLALAAVVLAANKKRRAHK